MKSCIIVGAGGRGKDCYAPYIKEKNLMNIVGVAEPDIEKRKEFQNKYGISNEMCFSDYKDLFARERLADCVMICTLDKLHEEPAVLASKRGYHIFLEKPIGTTEDEILRLESNFKNYDKTFITGFVLRYTPFIEKIKKIVESGEIGEVITMQLNENEGFWHHAHSYVRGPWNNSETSSPLIVAKSCHDFDLMMYLLGSKCVSVSSFGSNSFFKAENAPKNVPDRCTDGCPFGKECQYNAVKLYTEGEARYFVHKFGCKDTNEDIINALKSNPYGRCVYRCDNNVCDHQVANLEFESGATAVFTVSAFSQKNTRTIKLMGTKGEVGGCMEEGVIVLKRFNDMSTEKFNITHDGTRHCGGDGGLLRYFSKLIQNENGKPDEWVFKSHKTVFAAEKSRVEKRIVEL